MSINWPGAAVAVGATAALGAGEAVAAVAPTGAGKATDAGVAGGAPAGAVAVFTGGPKKLGWPVWRFQASQINTKDMVKTIHNTVRRISVMTQTQLL
jgi:hypothetical protein